MMAVDHHIVRDTQRTILLHIGNAVVAILLIKAALPIFEVLKAAFPDNLSTSGGEVKSVRWPCRFIASSFNL